MGLLCLRPVKVWFGIEAELPFVLDHDYDRQTLIFGSSGYKQSVSWFVYLILLNNTLEPVTFN
jgi:hypothetical protein